MNAIVKNARKLVAFAQRLGRDTRGEDYAEKTPFITTAGKVVITAGALGAAAAGAATVANNANHGGDKTGSDINNATGAQVDKTNNQTSVFQNK